jgi:hypothetical protein
MPIAIVGEDGSPGHAHAEADQRSCIRIIGIPWIINSGRIRRDVHDGWICRSELDDFLGHLDHLCDVGLQHDNVRDGDDLLVGSFEMSCLLSLGSEILDGVH